MSNILDERGINMKPIIGIVPSINEDANQYYSNIENAEAIVRVDGLPYLLPYVTSNRDMLQIVNVIDGLYLAGGNDVDPKYYEETPHENIGEINPTRDIFELNLLKMMFKRNKPVLGVCKGMQMINVALGGDLYQDVISQCETELIQHKQRAKITYPTHPIYVKAGTKLYRMIRKKNVYVNSYHHQAVRRLGENLIVSSYATDGIIEAIESTVHSFVIGVQWHPECLIVSEDSDFLTLYESFIHHCRKKK